MAVFVEREDFHIMNVGLLGVKRIDIEYYGSTHDTDRARYTWGHRPQKYHRRSDDEVEARKTKVRLCT